MIRSIAPFIFTVLLFGFIGISGFRQFFVSPSNPSGTTIAFGLFGLIGALCFYIAFLLIERRKFSLWQLLLITLLVATLFGYLVYQLDGRRISQ